MRVVRRHLRLGAATWLVCHALAFSALLPRDCCAAHAHSGAAAFDLGADHSAHGQAAADEHAHHAQPGSAADGAACPMRAADGTACPMHDGAGAAPVSCQMTGVCNQPAAALAAVLIQAAVPPAGVALAAPPAARVRVSSLADQPRSLATPPDSPPPRL
ncbi:MAG: hypothetical protein AB7U83_15420 [Vicinamibacterales bacterium]